MEQTQNKTHMLARWPAYDGASVEQMLQTELRRLDRKIVVLDDDPTGVQTVHDVSVYTDWSPESIAAGFAEPGSMFFILTNSRGLTADQSAALHRDIARRAAACAEACGKKFLLLSRGDSTLRGHYPLETQVLRDTLEACGQGPVDGEILMPFFPEGGRYTIGNIHYVAEGETLVPAGQTEFARDKTFGYASSDLNQWVEEKTRGQYPAGSVIDITLDELRARDYAGIAEKLLCVKGFGKVAVNAIDYDDVKVFVTALARVLRAGKNFLFRTAAALPKVLGGVSDKPLLTQEQLTRGQNRNGGVVIAGSHVHKTTRQLERLRQAKNVVLVEFDQHLALDDQAFAEEQRRVLRLVEESIRAELTVVVSTRRQRFDLNTGNQEDELRLAAKISNALTGIVSALNVRPGFMIAKGGITSSDVGTKGLGVKRATVLGQILEGVPVWLTGPESKFPDMPFVIFPGNVGDDDALLQAVRRMRPEREGEKE